ncbi:MAG: TIGR02466 family protein [Halioglobus sp.]
MSGKITLNNEFSVPIFNIQLDGFEQHKQALVDHFLGLRANDSGASKTNQGGWHSRDDLYKSGHPSVQWLVQTIFRAGAESVKQARLLPPGFEIAMSGCWVNINESGDWNSPHNHLPDEWSGACYIDVNSKSAATVKSDKDGDIIFFNPLPLSVQYQRAATIIATPASGTMYLFPGYLMHMVAPHFEARPRISVAFNLKLNPVTTGQAPRRQ